MAKYGVSRKVVVLMVLNVLLDAFIGSIPVIGNIFDFTYRANQKNIRLLKKHYHEGKYQGSGTGIIILVFIVLFAGLILLAYGLFKLTQLIFNQIASII
jgi:MFS superfamily sulfate permease-like transporter